MAKVAGRRPFVIEGCRLLPWLKEADRKGDLVIGDCAKCKASLPQAQRQSLGCGYEPSASAVAMWSHPGYTGPAPTVCPGYSTSLPEVLETAVARLHWSKGQNIGDSEDLKDAVLIMEGSYNELQAWLMKPAKDGGGAG